MPGGTFTYNTDESDTDDTDFFPDGASYIEATDVMALSDGTTWSKHYNGGMYGRIKDCELPMLLIQRLVAVHQADSCNPVDYVGKSSSTAGVWMIRSNHEKASGGPFFRCLQRRADTSGEDLYEIYYYNMGHTDPERFGLQGPSVLSFTDGSTPNTALFARNADWSWFDGLGIDGWVPTSGRGAIAGVGLSNMKSGREYTVGLSNADAQYWGTASSTGAWSIKNALPGTYTLTVYKDELEVYTGSTTITAGESTAVNTITCVDPSDTTAIWRIGDWDGTPSGFVNFVEKPWKPTFMHPSDTRLDAWDAGNYIVNTSSESSFPSYMWSGINNGHIIYFKLTAAQLAAAHTVRIGITEAYINGRPKISVNSWESETLGATAQASTRSFTVGTYRGNNVVLEFEVPASAWQIDAATFNGELCQSEVYSEIIPLTCCSPHYQCHLGQHRQWLLELCHLDRLR